MAKIIWSESALKDIELIAEFIARDSKERASLFVQRLISAVERLTSFPHSGRIVPEVGEEKDREVIYGVYRIMYRVEEAKSGLLQ